MRRDAMRIEAGEGRGAFLDDQVDGLWRQRLAADIAHWSIARNRGPAVMAEAVSQRGAPSPACRRSRHRRRRRRRLSWSGRGAARRPAVGRRHRQREGPPRSGHPRRAATPLRSDAAPRTEGKQQDGAIPDVGGPVHPAGAEQCLDQIARQCTLALAHRRSRRRSHREAQGRADLAVGEGALEPAPAVHRAPESEPAGGPSPAHAVRSRQGPPGDAGSRRPPRACHDRGRTPGGSDPRGDGQRTSGAARGRRARAERLRWPRGHQRSR